MYYPPENSGWGYDGAPQNNYPGGHNPKYFPPQGKYFQQHQG